MWYDVIFRVRFDKVRLEYVGVEKGGGDGDGDGGGVGRVGGGGRRVIGGLEGYL